MRPDMQRMTDEVSISMRRAREMANDLGLTGHGVVRLWNEREGTKLLVPFSNLITTAGDQYYAKRGIQGIGGYSYSTVVNGMKYGTGTNAVHKSTSGAANIQTYVSGSNRSTWDGGYPTSSAVAGTDTGWYATYQITWDAGVASNSAITEAALVFDATSNTDGSSVANTISRVTFTAVNKTAQDALTITWNHKMLGSP